MKLLRTLRAAAAMSLTFGSAVFLAEAALPIAFRHAAQTPSRLGLAMGIAALGAVAGRMLIGRGPVEFASPGRAVRSVAGLILAVGSTLFLLGCLLWLVLAIPAAAHALPFARPSLTDLAPRDPGAFRLATAVAAASFVLGLILMQGLPWDDASVRFGRLVGVGAAFMVFGGKAPGLAEYVYRADWIGMARFYGLVVPFSLVVLGLAYAWLEFDHWRRRKHARDAREGRYAG
jgi:hypothetical protein